MDKIKYLLGLVVLLTLLNSCATKGSDVSARLNINKNEIKTNTNTTAADTYILDVYLRYTDYQTIVVSYCMDFKNTSADISTELTVEINQKLISDKTLTYYDSTKKVICYSRPIPTESLNLTDGQTYVAKVNLINASQEKNTINNKFEYSFDYEPTKSSANLYIKDIEFVPHVDGSSVYYDTVQITSCLDYVGSGLGYGETEELVSNTLIVTINDSSPVDFRVAAYVDVTNKGCVQSSYQLVDSFQRGQTYNVLAVIDPDNLQQELDENDNSSTYSFFYPLPYEGININFAQPAVFYSPEGQNPYIEVYVCTGYQNLIDENYVDVPVLFTNAYDFVKTEVVTAKNLGPASLCKKLSRVFADNELKKGQTYTFYITADGTFEIDEFDETDNLEEFTFTY